MTPATLVVTRTFPAPRATVFAVWTEPAHIAAASAPPGGTFSSPVFELRPGGRHHYCARTAEGAETWGLRQFLSVTPGQRLEWRQSFSNAQGEPARHPMAPAFPLFIHTVLTFEDAGPAATKLTLTWDPADASEAEVAFFTSMHEGMRGGWAHTFDQIEGYVKTLK